MCLNMFCLYQDLYYVGVQATCGGCEIFLYHRDFQRTVCSSLGDQWGHLVGHERIPNAGLFFHSPGQMAQVSMSFCFDIRPRLIYYSPTRWVINSDHQLGAEISFFKAIWLPHTLDSIARLPLCMCSCRRVDALVPAEGCPGIYQPVSRLVSSKLWLSIASLRLLCNEQCLLV